MKNESKYSKNKSSVAKIYIYIAYLLKVHIVEDQIRKVHI